MSSSIKKRIRSARGFTLVELMIVVAIVGILAALAIYGVRRYLTNAKSAEARNSLGQMSKDAVVAFEREQMAGTVLAAGAATAISRKFCTSASATVPAAATSVKAAKYQSAVTDWAPTADADSVGFKCLKFSLTEPQYFLYNYTATNTAAGPADGDGFAAIARGDLDGDTTLSTFQMNGALTNGAVRVSPTVIETDADE